MEELQLEYPIIATRPNHSLSAAEFIAGRWLIDYDVANELLRAFEAAATPVPAATWTPIYVLFSLIPYRCAD